MPMTEKGREDSTPNAAGGYLVVPSEVAYELCDLPDDVQVVQQALQVLIQLARPRAELVCKTQARLPAGASLRGRNAKRARRSGFRRGARFPALSTLSFLNFLF